MINTIDLTKLFGSVEYCNKEKLIHILSELANYIADMETQRKTATDSLAAFNMDDRIKELEKKLEIERKRHNDSWNFSIKPENVARIEEWQTKHEKEKHNSSGYAGTIGGRYTYEFTPTSIGTFGRIKCSCGDYFDFDDGSDW